MIWPQSLCRAKGSSEQILPNTNGHDRTHLDDLADVSLVDFLIGPAAADHHAHLDVVAHVHSVVVIVHEICPLFVQGGAANDLSWSCQL